MRFLSVLLSLLLFIPLANAKNKKIALPDYVLKARTVLVIVSPEATTSLLNPDENRAAREDVEKALLRWGRYSLAMDGEGADLIIAVSKGGGNRAVNPTIGGGPRDDRPVIFEPTDGAIRVGGHRGQPPDSTGAAGPPESASPGISKGSGSANDMFEVYQGGMGSEDRLDGPATWRYVAKDGLRSPAVPAVDQFRKVVEQADKDAQSRGKGKP